MRLIRQLGTVSNVGLMAQKAEMARIQPLLIVDGRCAVIAANGDVIHEHTVGAGDIWRMATTKPAPIVDWVRLGLARQQATGADAVFWLNAERAHDAQLIAYVEKILAEDHVDRGTIHILAPREATNFTLRAITAGKDCISITGNVLRDYLTDLFLFLNLAHPLKCCRLLG